MVREIRIEDFDYDLPDERIPRHPLAQRDACRLLLSRPDGKVSHRRFGDLASLLPPGAMLVCNDTRVINARFSFHKPTGGRIEVFLLEPVDPSDYVLTFQTRGRCVWNCLVGNLKKWKEGSLSMEIHPDGVEQPVTLTARRLHPTSGNGHAVEFSWDNPDVTFASVVDAAGFIPIPPYLKRESEESDREDYQTVYARTKGSVAAPTAGLHFTPAVFDDLAAHNIEVGKLTLHVGAGTFQPVKSENIGGHPMHTESFSVTRDLLECLRRRKREGLPLVAVGTTSVRTLESLPYLGDALAHGDESLHVGQWDAYSPRAAAIDTVAALDEICRWLDRKGETVLTASTAIMIAPGFRWRMTDAMVTNFHQPQSTLLLLVSSFLGAKDWRELYGEALSEGYRFLSYGDACLLFPCREGEVTLPASKSIGARVAVASFFAGKLQDCPDFDDCDDLRVIRRAVGDLAACSCPDEDASGMKDPASGDGMNVIDIHASGTAFRFMAAVIASTPGTEILLTGTHRLCGRPMSPLLDVLRQAGASITSRDAGGNGPYIIKGGKLKGGEFEIRGDISSQFISAIMLAAPGWENGVRLHFSTPLVSRPYAEMTAGVMRQFGIDATITEDGVTVCPGKYVMPENLKVEADWSAAGFFYEAAVIGGIPLRIASLLPPGKSLQGDAATAGFFERLGIVTRFEDNSAALHKIGEMQGNIEVDFSDNPDLVPAFAVAAALSGCIFTFTGVRNLRLKESDRLMAMRNELAKLGFSVETGEDSISWDGKMIDTDGNAVIDTYDDHRIAMSFAMTALSSGRIEIRNPEVVGKSFERFWEAMAAVGLECRREGDRMIVERRS